MLLTRRARHLRRHAGQMSFPGGVAEPGDDSLQATAMRETTEETGIHGDFIQPLGKLGDMMTISGYRLHIFLGWLQPGFAVVPDPNEVETVYAADVEIAMDAAQYQWHLRETPAGHLRMPEMTLEQQRVWGITAVIIWHLSRLWHDQGSKSQID
jgi:8-oxo-dGTP pyrophosphatase MutT (NUDIX family)